MKRLLLLTVCSVVFLASSTRLMAWGCNGHQVVAYIAERELNPVALSNAVTLLTTFPITIHRNCTALPGTTPMSDAATWADDVRFLRKNTAPWHFVDVPLEHAGEDPNNWCNGSCVIKAINDQMQVLRTADLQNPDEATAEALRFVIHFVGDLHQPLHATTNTDRGGNCVPLAFGNRKPHAKGTSYSPELHGIWDTEMVQELGANSATDDTIGLAQLLDKEITERQRHAWSSKTPTEWAIESTKFAASTAYKGLTNSHGDVVDASGLAGSEVNGGCDGTVESKIVAMGIEANANYRSASEAVIEERLKQAGVRLAFLLNSIWPDENATAAHAAVHKGSAKQ